MSRRAGWNAPGSGTVQLIRTIAPRAGTGRASQNRARPKGTGLLTAACIRTSIGHCVPEWGDCDHDTPPRLIMGLWGLDSGTGRRRPHAGLFQQRKHSIDEEAEFVAEIEEDQ